MSETEWMVDRTKLYALKQTRPQAKVCELAEAVGRSERWVRKWLARFASHEGDATAMFCGRSRARKTPNKIVSQEVVEAVLDIRDNPPAGLNRIPGPKTILYYLPKHDTLQGSQHYIPRSATTIWSILSENGRIYRRQPQPRKPEPLSEPMADWQMDFKSVSTVPPEEGGKQQHVVETLNMVDKGTSIAVACVPRADYHTKTVLVTLIDVFTQHGLPYTLTLDRDPRFVGAWSAKEFPSVVLRFLYALGVTPHVCPPHRPQKNAFVERFNGSYGRECLQVHLPDTAAKTVTYTAQYYHDYNYERPHQGRACQNLPPRVAYPDARTQRALPPEVDPDAWLRFASLRWYKRRITSSGSIQIGNQRYYIKKKLAKQQVAVRVLPAEKQLAIYQGNHRLKTVAIKGLYHGSMPLADYVDAILEEALTEWRRRDVQRRYRARRHA